MNPKYGQTESVHHAELSEGERSQSSTKANKREQIGDNHGENQADEKTLSAQSKVFFDATGINDISGK